MNILGLFNQRTEATQAAPVELPSPSLADEAMSIVGFHDAMLAQSLVQLREYRNRLADNIERETEALAEVDAVITREEQANAKPEPAKRSRKAVEAAE